MTKLSVTSGPPPRAEPLLARGAVVGGVIAGKYRIERVIGHGGMGVVVAARHLQLERTVAIKLIRGDWADDPLAVERLVREAKALASIQSEHVARVLDVGTLADGIPFIVMEYLEGRDLATLLERDGPLPIVDAIDFILQACEALAEAHRNGIVHRDIKPANLFVARQPGGVASIKVVDFGISKLINSASVESLTHPSRIVGSLYHMAPEQMRGEAVDARTDVWAIGVLLFELVTGRKPWQDASWPAVCARVLNEAAPPLAIGDGMPEDLAAALRRCLSRAPEDRYANVAELAVALSPLGGRSARVSLERIVRLATSTGSLAAEALSPLPPGARNSAPSAPSRALRDVSLDPESGEENRLSSVGSGTSLLPRPASLSPAVLPSQPASLSRTFVPGLAQPSAVAPAAPGAGASLELPEAAAPRRRRRELWGAAATALALLIGLPWLCARAGHPNQPAAPTSEVANAALLPDRARSAEAGRDAPEGPRSAPPSSVEGSQPGAGESAPSAAASGALPALPALPGTPHEPAPAVASVPAPAERAASSEPPAGGARAAAQPSAAPSEPPHGSAAQPGARAEQSPLEAPAPKPTEAAAAEAQPGAAKSSAHSAAPITAGQARGSNPWDLRDLEFE
jgi:serine/threonine-protein kinase